MLTTGNEKLTRYELLPGEVYIAPGDVPKDEATRTEYYAGPTVGGIEIAVHENVYPVRDRNGDTVCELHSGARLEVKGKLASVTPAAIERLFGAKRGADGNYEIVAAPDARTVGLSVICPIRGESDAFTMYMRASGVKGTAKLDGAGRDVIEFSLTSERDFGRRAAKMSLRPAALERRDA